MSANQFGHEPRIKETETKLTRVDWKNLSPERKRLIGAAIKMYIDFLYTLPQFTDLSSKNN